MGVQIGATWRIRLKRSRAAAMRPFNDNAEPPVTNMGSVKTDAGSATQVSQHGVSKNVPHLACYNFDTCERLLTYFITNVSDKVRNQKTVYYVTSNNLCFCTT